MLTALDHVIFAVRDLEQARAGYEKLLGIRASWSGVHPDGGTANVLFRLENTYLELLSPAGPGAASEQLALWLDSRGEGLLGLAFATEDIESCCRTLTERGLAPGPIIEGHEQDVETGRERRWRRSMLPTGRTRGLFLFPIQHDSPADTLPAGVPTGSADAAVHALDHAVVQTTDADLTRALFADSLGLRLAVDKEFPQWGVRLLFFRIGGITLEVAGVLAGKDAAGFAPAAGATTDGDRLYGMSYRVRAIELARERLHAAGVDVSEVRGGRRPRTRVFTVRDGTCGVPTLVIELEGEEHRSTRAGES